MQSHTFGRWRLRVDREATERMYRAMAQGCADRCGCIYCRNFIAARELVYPPEVRALLSELGIDYRHEVDLYEAGTAEAGKCAYEGEFCAVGEIESEGTEVGRFDLESGPGPFQFYFHATSRFCSEFAVGRKKLALSFEASVPWVLAEEMPARGNG